jgi:hypothetical protein
MRAEVQRRFPEIELGRLEGEAAGSIFAESPDGRRNVLWVFWPDAASTRLTRGASICRG